MAAKKIGFIFLIILLLGMAGASNAQTVSSIQYNGIEYTTSGSSAVQFPAYESGNCKAQMRCGSAGSTAGSACKFCTPCTCTIERKDSAGRWMAEQNSPYKNEVCASAELPGNLSSQQCRASTMPTLNGYVNDEWASCRARCL
ncbi:MAG: hypothetical protein EYC62_09760 [Alphaproteobacteria bacterium]|nr:MAG: hypothetical protein EYC62_09760 [Alphaproteobacteria bacterium]